MSQDTLLEPIWCFKCGDEPIEEYIIDGDELSLSWCECFNSSVLEDLELGGSVW